MSKRKHDIRGRIYIINDSLVSRDNYSKPNRRVVAVNNDKNNVHIMKIKSLYDKKGNRRNNLITIESYNCLTKPSGIEKKVHKKTSRNNPICENLMKKTKTRLNKWDMKKIGNYH